MRYRILFIIRKGNNWSFLPVKILEFLILLCFTNVTIAQNKINSKKDVFNVVFILADDLGWNDLSCYGSRFYETPNIDSLANDGMLFNRAYAASPVCSPTRASILTGKYPVRTGVTDVINVSGAREPENWNRNTPLLPAHYSLRLDLEENTIARELKDYGYKTYFAGKWHLGAEGFWPEEHGFEINKGGWSAGMPSSYFSPYNNPKLPDGFNGEYLPERLTLETLKFINHFKDSVFFIFQSLYLVHTPIQAKDNMIGLFDLKRESLGLGDKFGEEGESKIRLNQSNPVYAAMVKAMDEEVGKIVRSLKSNNLYEKTIIIFTSDNGGLSSSEGYPTSNSPLRGGKGWMYEGGLRVPLIVRLPGITSPGTVCDAPVISIDFFPTILDVLKLDQNKKNDFDGDSFRKQLEGEKTKNKRPFYWHYPHYSNQGAGPASCILYDDWKLVRWYKGKGEIIELYNLKNDPEEKIDLSKTYPRKVGNLNNKLSRFLLETSAKFPTVNPNFTGKN